MRSNLNTHPEPLFGLKFSEAKRKVIILDIRSALAFNANNLKEDKRIKIPYIHVHWKDIVDEKGNARPIAAKILSDKGLTPDLIILLLGEPEEDLEKVQMALMQINYKQSLRIEGNHKDLLYSR